MHRSTSTIFSARHTRVPTFVSGRQFSLDYFFLSFLFIGRMISKPKAFHERRQPSAAVSLNKKVRIGFLIALFELGTIAPLAFHVCMFVAFLATVQVTLLLFARLERSRTPTSNA